MNIKSRMTVGLSQVDVYKILQDYLQRQGHIVVGDAELVVRMDDTGALASFTVDVPVAHLGYQVKSRAGMQVASPATAVGV